MTRSDFGAVAAVAAFTLLAAGAAVATALEAQEDAGAGNDGMCEGMLDSSSAE